jgi:hypothetical protein
MRTSELSGAALDWAVAMAIGDYTPVRVPTYSTDWAHGGKIIEREGIAVWQFDDVTWRAIARYAVPDPIEGATPLVAAMRAYVTSKLGDEVQLPEGI